MRSLLRAVVLAATVACGSLSEDDDDKKPAAQQPTADAGLPSNGVDAGQVDPQPDASIPDVGVGIPPTIVRKISSGKFDGTVTLPMPDGVKANDLVVTIVALSTTLSVGGASPNPVLQWTELLHHNSSTGEHINVHSRIHEGNAKTISFNTSPGTGKGYGWVIAYEGGVSATAVKAPPISSNTALRSQSVDGKIGNELTVAFTGRSGSKSNLVWSNPAGLLDPLAVRDDEKHYGLLAHTSLTQDGASPIFESTVSGGVANEKFAEGVALMILVKHTN